MNNKLEIFNNTLVDIMIMTTRDQYGLQEPEYEAYLDKVQETKKLDLLNPYTIELIKNFTNILPDIKEIVWAL